MRRLLSAMLGLDRRSISAGVAAEMVAAHLSRIKASSYDDCRATSDIAYWLSWSVPKTLRLLTKMENKGSVELAGEYSGTLLWRVRPKP